MSRVIGSWTRSPATVEPEQSQLNLGQRPDPFAAEFLGPDPFRFARRVADDARCPAKAASHRSGQGQGSAHQVAGPKLGTDQLMGPAPRGGPGEPVRGLVVLEIPPEPEVERHRPNKAPDPNTPAYEAVVPVARRASVSRSRYVTSSYRPLAPRLQSPPAVQWI